MENELVVENRNQLTAKQVKADVQLIQEVMKSVMKDKVHYGTIPGCGDKPTLLKPGAEKLAATFKLSADPEIEDLCTDDEAKYRIKVRLTHMPTGNYVGAGIGECSSNETKYRWRKVVCNEEYDEALEDEKREIWKAGYGDKQNYKVKQIKTNISDIANTILKMAKKRAIVDAILTATAASDIFTQDIEDMPQEIVNQSQKKSSKPKTEPPKAKSEQKDKPANAISEPQRKRLFAIAMNAGMTKDDFKEWLHFNYEIESSTNITRDSYEEICTAAENYKNE